MMEKKTVLSLLDSISGNDSLWKKFLDALQGPSQRDEVGERDSTPPDSYKPPVRLQLLEKANWQPMSSTESGSNSSLGTNAPQLNENASLGTNALQSRGVSPLGANVLQSSGDPLGDGGPQYTVSERSATTFDPSSLSSEDEFTFDTSSSGNNRLS